MEKRFICYTIIISILSTSCKKEYTDLSNVPLAEINVEQAYTCYLDDIAMNVECYNLVLPMDYYFGEITDIFPLRDSLLLFHDYYTKQIHIFDQKGKFINVLNQIGRGPGEYMNIEAFTVDQLNKQLIVYDHNGGQKLITYTLPELRHISTQRLTKSLMSLASLSNNTLFTISDEDDGPKSTKCDGAEMYNIRENKFKTCDIPNNYVTINLSYPRTISYTENKYYYTCPYLHPIVYELNASKIIPILQCHFGKQNLPETLLKSNDATKFEEIVEANNYALMPQYFLKQDSICSFFFFNGSPEKSYMAITNLKGDVASKVIKEIKLKGIATSSPLKPLGVINNRYAFLLYPYSCEIDKEYITTSPISQDICKKMENTPDEGTPVLLLFEPNFNETDEELHIIYVDANY